jgi:hypothetical protein
LEEKWTLPKAKKILNRAQGKATSIITT